MGHVHKETDTKTCIAAKTTDGPREGSTNCGDIHTVEYAPKYKGTNQRAATWMSLRNTEERRPHTKLHTV